ncbi:Cytochrome P450 52A5 [Paramyrothecium foliicola]|nr:Cytochrome P450 52A5 [Paramyrothecium foliicola]
MHPPFEVLPGLRSAPGADGLEVVPYDINKPSDTRAGNAPQVQYDGQAPEVYCDQNAPEVVYDKNGLYVHGEEADKQRMIGASNTSTDSSIKERVWWKRRQFLIPLLLLTLFAIVGAAVGGVLGVQAIDRETSGSSTSGRPQETPSNPPAGSLTSSESPSSSRSSSVPTATAVPTSIRPRSPLSATSFRDKKTNQSTIFLAYQSLDGNFQVARYVKPDGKHKGSWEQPQVASPARTPKELSALTISVINDQFDAYQQDLPESVVRLQLNVVGEYNDIIRLHAEALSPELNFQHYRDWRDNGSEIAATSTLASYGNTRAFLNATGGLILSADTLAGGKSKGFWLGTNPDAVNATKLAVVPLTTNTTKLYKEHMFIVWYQWAQESSLRPWYSGNGTSYIDYFPHLVTVTREGSFTALSVPRPTTAFPDAVNIFLIYQDRTNDFVQMYLDEEYKWKFSAPEAFKGADAGSSITCTNPVLMDTEGSSDMDAASDMTRCFFRKDGYVVEVQLDGTDWTMLEKNFELGPYRRNGFWPFVGGGIFTVDGISWKHARNAIAPHFRNPYANDLDILEKHVSACISLIENSGHQEGSKSHDIDIWDLIGRYAMDSASEYVFGRSVDVQHRELPAKGQPPDRSHKVDFYKASFIATLAVALRSGAQNLYWMVEPRGFRNACQVSRMFIRGFLHKVLSDRKNSQSSPSPPDQTLVTGLLEAYPRQNDLESESLTLLIAGRDNTGAIIVFILLLLARHPVELQRLRATLIEEFGAHPQSSKASENLASKLLSCELLQDVINEALRLFPVVPLNSRVALEDSILPRGGSPTGDQPVLVLKGETVFYSPYVLHRREDIWGDDAKCFRPLRWKGRKVGSEFQPFGLGPRKCLGSKCGWSIAIYWRYYDKQ